MKKIAGKIFNASINSVRPECLVKGYSEKVLSYYSRKKFSSLIVTGFGKAAYRMAEAFEGSIDTEMISGGVIVTKYGHAGKENPEYRARTTDLKKIMVFEAGHPIPDENGKAATEEIKKLIKKADASALVVCLVSGGGSALFVSPVEGITLNEKKRITDLLLRGGADITELNIVRKHLSGVKGGRLAEIAYPAEVISLMISDVIGDKLDVIASGPTAPDPSTFKDALDVIDKYQLAEKTPAGIMDVLNRGMDGSIQDTPKMNNPAFEKVQNIIIGSNRAAIEAAEKEAEALGFETRILSTMLEGEAGKVGKLLAGKAKGTKAQSSKGTKCLISGGETTVIVKGKGKGGRNMELALYFAMEIEGVEGITMLSAGTDGTDGPTDAAGAIVDGQTIVKAKGVGLNPQEYLDNNDSYNFFKQLDSLLITGPTGTNVMDIQIILIE